jgi:hypothetical protein
MRHLLLVVMMILLPARGWAGNEMAVGMAASMVTSATAKAGESMMSADCPMHFQTLVADTGNNSNPTSKSQWGSGCNSCDTCELCLALATVSHIAWPSGGASPHIAPLTTGIAFHSADSASSLKPPIS